MNNIQKNKATVKFIIFTAVLIGCWILSKFAQVDIDYYQKLFQGYPAVISGIIFVVLYVVLTFFIWFGPKDVFRVSAAILFGPYLSTVYVFISEMINAALLFHFSRKFGREFIEERFKIKSKNFDKIEEKSRGILGPFTLRINPFIPFRIQDLGTGLITHFHFKKYLLAILPASLIRIFWLQSILAGIGISILKDIPSTLEYLLDNPAIILWSSVYFLSVLALSLVYLILKLGRKNSR